MAQVVVKHTTIRARSRREGVLVVVGFVIFRYTIARANYILPFFFYCLHMYWKNNIHFPDLIQEPLFYIKINWNLGIELKTVSGLIFTHRKLTRKSIISKKKKAIKKIAIKLNKGIDAILFLIRRPYANEENGLKLAFLLPSSHL